MDAYLVIREGTKWTDVVRMVEGRTVMIGRAPTNQIVIKDERCSRNHAEIFFTGEFSSESVMVHRVVFAENYRTEFRFVDESDTKSTDWYQIRVAQTNDSYAWSSPIWVSGHSNK